MDILELTAGSAALMLTAPVVSTIAQAADESASAVLKDTNEQNVGTASTRCAGASGLGTTVLPWEDAD